MKRKRFSEEQIIEILRLHKAGAKPVDLCRQRGISDATLYNWRNRYGGMQASDTKRLQSLEEENHRLKKLLAEAMLDNAALKDIASGPEGRRSQSSEARGPASGDRSCLTGLRAEPAPSLRADWNGREQLPIPLAPSRRWSLARTATEPGPA